MPGNAKLTLSFAPEDPLRAPEGSRLRETKDLLKRETRRVSHNTIRHTPHPSPLPGEGWGEG